MRTEVLAVTWYRTRATWARRRGGLASLALLIAVLGGVAMGSLAAARRTQASYPKFLASTTPSDLVVSSFGANTVPTSSNAPATLTPATMRRLPHVARVESLIVLTMAPLGADGAPETARIANLAPIASLDGLLFDQDRVAVVGGRMADPHRADEFMTTADGARLLGVRVGQSVPFGEYTPAQTSLPGFGTAAVRPHVRLDARLVGIVVINNQVVQDDIDRYPTFAIFTPTFARTVAADANATLFGLRLQRGSRDVTAVEQEFVHGLHRGSTYEFHETSLIEARVERAVKPESIALGVFGAVAGIAALVIAALAVSRQLAAGEADLEVLRALGAGPSATAMEGMAGVFGAIALGSLLAGAVAAAISPLAPVGPVRAVYPTPGVSMDWTVVGLGMLATAAGLGAIATVLAFRRAPHRTARRARLAAARGSAIARAAAAHGMPAPGVVGLGFALDPGAGRAAVPVRSALAGAALAVITVVATLTFGSGLHTLVSRPALYGWNWSYVLNPNQNFPLQTLTVLDHDADVAGWASADEVIFSLDGHNVAGLLGDHWDQVSPPILTGHTIAATDQIVVGSATLALLRKHVGDHVTFSYGAPQDAPIYIPPTTLTIVGTTTMPAVGFTSFVADHSSMGTGAIVSNGVVPQSFKAATDNPDPLFNGPQLVMVRLRAGLSPAAGLADMQRVATDANRLFDADPAAAGDSVAVLGVQRPAEIVNYRSMGSTPLVLAGGLAAGAIVALGLTLTASVRRRRRDLALLKALGFTRRQLAETVAWQATVAAAAGLIAGVPLGIALGRQLWILFARNIDAVPEPTVPVLPLLLVSLGALVLANLVAAAPGRAAGRTPTALVLRAE